MWFELFISILNAVVMVLALQYLQHCDPQEKKKKTFNYARMALDLHLTIWQYLKAKFALTI